MIDAELYSFDHGSTLQWQTSSENEYSGWRFCLMGASDVYSMQANWTNCSCNGVSSVAANYGAYCGLHDWHVGFPWCYTDPTQCPDAYLACWVDSNTRWFFCDDSSP